MKKVLFVAAFAVALSVCSCGAKATESEGSAAPDEVAEVEEAPVEEFTTPDLDLLGVKGHVKDITNDGVIYAVFNEDGTLEKYGNNDKISHIERNADNQLTSFLGAEWMEVTWENNRPVTIVNSYNELKMTFKHTYGDNGQIEKIVVVYEDFIDETETTTTIVQEITYPEDAFDAHGNWVKRTVTTPESTYTETRKITYFE